MPKPKNPGKPAALKIAQGNPGQRKIKPEPIPAPLGSYEPPEHLNDMGKAAWREMVANLAEVGLLMSADKSAFALLCQAYAEMRELDELIKEEGYTTVFPTGAIQQHPLIGTRDRARTLFVKLVKEFGMTPSARVGLPANEGKSNSVLDSFKNRKGA